MDEIWIEALVAAGLTLLAALVNYLRKKGKIGDDVAAILTTAIEDAAQGNVPGVDPLAAKTLKGRIRTLASEAKKSVQEGLADKAAEADPKPERKKRPVLKAIGRTLLRSVIGG